MVYIFAIYLLNCWFTKGIPYQFHILRQGYSVTAIGQSFAPREGSEQDIRSLFGLEFLPVANAYDLKTFGLHLQSKAKTFGANVIHGQKAVIFPCGNCYVQGPALQAILKYG